MGKKKITKTATKKSAPKPKAKAPKAKREDVDMGSLLADGVNTVKVGEHTISKDIAEKIDPKTGLPKAAKLVPVQVPDEALLVIVCDKHGFAAVKPKANGEKQIGLIEALSAYAVTKIATDENFRAAMKMAMDMERLAKAHRAMAMPTAGSA